MKWISFVGQGCFLLLSSLGVLVTVFLTKPFFHSQTKCIEPHSQEHKEHQLGSLMTARTWHFRIRVKLLWTTLLCSILAVSYCYQLIPITNLPHDFLPGDTLLRLKTVLDKFEPIVIGSSLLLLLVYYVFNWHLQLGIGIEQPHYWYISEQPLLTWPLIRLK